MTEAPRSLLAMACSGLYIYICRLRTVGLMYLCLFMYSMYVYFMCISWMHGLTNAAQERLSRRRNRLCLPKV